MDPSTELLAARRELYSINGYELLKDLYWHGEEKLWVIECRLKHGIENGTIPEATDWHLLIAPDYPRGFIGIYPSASNGLTFTFPHQNYNQPGRYDWWTGKLCLEDHLNSLGISKLNMEPAGPDGRLKWHVERALDWLESAANNSLLSRGHPFELPPLPANQVSMLIAFNESDATFGFWSGQKIRSGLVTVSTHGANVLCLRSYCSQDGAVLIEPAWGTAISTAAESQIPGAWVYINALPVVEHWRLPATWGELLEVLEREGVHLMQLIEDLATHSRLNKPAFLLIGFPIPETVGAARRQNHWLAVRLPEWPDGQVPPKGWRNNRESLLRYYQVNNFRANDPLTWIETKNWNASQISTRGTASSGLRDQRVAVLGVGALGSVVAESLVRLGVHDLTLVDRDYLSAGNLVRHTLSVAEVGENKAKALAARLNLLSPHGTVDYIPENFPPSDTGAVERLRNCSIVIDCTAADEVSSALANFDWSTQKIFVSCSVSIHAARLYLYLERGMTFSQSEFSEKIEPWLQEDAEDHAETEFPWEGVGCWHPVFPARYDDFSLWASVITRHLDLAANQRTQDPTLTVFEQTLTQEGLSGVHVLSPSDP